jgi:hypothetical protein
MLLLYKRRGHMKEEKKTITVRLYEKENSTLDNIKKKYGISKSVQIETLIKKYAKKEYGEF